MNGAACLLAPTHGAAPHTRKCGAVVWHVCWFARNTGGHEIEDLGSPGALTSILQGPQGAEGQALSAIERPHVE